MGVVQTRAARAANAESAGDATAPKAFAFATLPGDVQCAVLAGMPASDLRRMSLSCKAIRARIRSPAFAKARAATMDCARALVAVDVVMPGIVRDRECTRVTGAAPDAGLLISGGGYGPDVQETTACWLLSDGAARRCAPMPGDRTFYSGCAWLGEEMVVIGGQMRDDGGYDRDDVDTDETAEVWAYHPGRDAWRELAPLPIFGGLGTCACGVVAGRLVVCGGAGTDIGLLINDVAHAYDADRDAWQRIEDMPGGGRYGIACAVHDGKLLVAGGRAPYGERLDELYIYDGTTWTQGPNMPRGGSHNRGVVLDGKFYVMGGFWEADNSRGVLVYDIRDGTWEDGPRLNLCIGPIGGAVAYDGMIVVLPSRRTGADYAERARVQDHIHGGRREEERLYAWWPALGAGIGHSWVELYDIPAPIHPSTAPVFCAVDGGKAMPPTLLL